jgi:hypothetical protein
MMWPDRGLAAGKALPARDLRNSPFVPDARITCGWEFFFANSPRGCENKGGLKRHPMGYFGTHVREQLTCART